MPFEEFPYPGHLSYHYKHLNVSKVGSPIWQTGKKKKTKIEANV